MNNLVLPAKMQPYTVIRENTWLTRDGMDFGWGNGYVHIPEGHPWFGVPYGEIDGIDVNGGLTFSKMQDGMWVIWFDTCHSWDTLSEWPEEAVQAEADKLLAQVISAMVQQ